jgi:hypothetical protein
MSKWLDRPNEFSVLSLAATILLGFIELDKVRRASVDILLN